MSADYAINRSIRPEALSEATTTAYEFHQRLSGYAPSPVVPLPEVCRHLGYAVSAKVESDRWTVPSFKGLGTTWATHCLVRDERRPGREVRELVTATEGNFGLAVAVAAAKAGVAARVFATHSIAASRSGAIRDAGAELILIDGDYEAALARGRGSCGEDSHWVSDTASQLDESFPRWVQQGYATISYELVEQLGLNDRGGERGAVVVPIGVGGLAASVAEGLRTRGVRVLGVEARSTACAVASLRAGRPTVADTGGGSVMQGLNCPQLSAVAWSAVRDGVDLCVAIDDESARRAQRELEACGVPTGAAGSAALAGFTTLAENRPDLLRAVGVIPGAPVTVLVTEAAT